MSLGHPHPLSPERPGDGVPGSPEDALDRLAAQMGVKVHGNQRADGMHIKGRREMKGGLTQSANRP